MSDDHFDYDDYMLNDSDVITIAPYAAEKWIHLK